jgi:ribosomal protein L11 methyltransferase
MVYIQYEFFTKDEAKRDFIISLLPEVGFDGFEELNNSIKAFVPKDNWDWDALSDILHQNALGDIDFEYTEIAPQNWNEQWEKSFDPLLIAGQVSIRAPFHMPQPATYELIIEPKMSFGTGHHPTTALMITQMLALDIKDKAVVDFGSGTGVLAILAEKLGAASVVAIDNEEWAVENSKENLGRNNAVKVKVLLGDSMDISQRTFDIMLANINRNVIMKNLQSWQNFLKPEGVLVVSGILVTDTKDITDTAENCGFSAEKVLTESGWVSILFKLTKFKH